MTNGDRIRQMSDEELVHIVRCPYLICPDIDINCNICILEWLREEVQEDDQR